MHHQAAPGDDLSGAGIWVQVPTRAWFAAVSLGVAGLVAAGMALQQLVRIAPCPLCIAQRALYLVIALLALGGVLWPRAARLWLAAIAVPSLSGLAIAGYQSWMQAYPHLAPECSYTDPNLIERAVDWLGMQWPSLFLATGFCSSRDWEFLGGSLANWSLLVFATLVAWTVMFWRRGR